MQNSLFCTRYTALSGAPYLVQQSVYYKNSFNLQPSTGEHNKCILILVNQRVL